MMEGSEEEEVRRGGRNEKGTTITSSMTTTGTMYYGHYRCYYEYVLYCTNTEGARVGVGSEGGE